MQLTANKIADPAKVMAAFQSPGMMAAADKADRQANLAAVLADQAALYELIQDGTPAGYLQCSRVFGSLVVNMAGRIGGGGLYTPTGLKLLRKLAAAEGCGAVVCHITDARHARVLERLGFATRERVMVLCGL